MSFEGRGHVRGRGHCRRKPGRAQQRSTVVSGEYTPDSARVEGSSAVDEPGEC